MAYPLFAYLPAILALMVSVGVERVRPRASLGSLLAERDASLAVRLDARTRLAVRMRAMSRGTGHVLFRVWRFVTTLLTLLCATSARHGLVLAGLGAWTWVAWSYSTYAGGVMLGASLFFLEARRR